MSYLNRDYYEGFFAQWQSGRLHGRSVAAPRLPAGAAGRVAQQHGCAWRHAGLVGGAGQPGLGPALNPRSLALVLVDAQGRPPACPWRAPTCARPRPASLCWLVGRGGPVLRRWPAVRTRCTWLRPMRRRCAGGPGAYALRFANADNAVTGVQWQPAQGAPGAGQHAHRAVSRPRPGSIACAWPICLGLYRLCLPAPGQCSGRAGPAPARLAGQPGRLPGCTTAR